MKRFGVMAIGLWVLVGCGAPPVAPVADGGAAGQQLPVGGSGGGGQGGTGGTESKPEARLAVDSVEGDGAHLIDPV